MYAMGVALVSKTFSLDRADKHLFLKQQHCKSTATLLIQDENIFPRTR